MGDGDKLLKEIKSRMEDKETPLSTDTAVQFLLSLQIERTEKEKEKENKRLIAEKEKSDAQEKINEKVKVLWRERKVALTVYGAILLGVLGVIFDAITITINTGS